MKKQAERVNIRGIAVYPHLNKADTKFVSQGEFKTGVRVAEADAAPIMKKLAAAFQEHTGKKINKHATNLWKIGEDDNGEPDGTIVFQTKVKNVNMKDGTLWDRKPQQFDSQAQPIDVMIYGGSEIVVAAEIYAWDAGTSKGISLQPRAVQVLKLVENTATNTDFGVVEGGFIAEKAEASFDPVEDAEGDDFDF